MQPYFPYSNPISTASNANQPSTRHPFFSAWGIAGNETSRRQETFSGCISELYY